MSVLLKVLGHKLINLSASKINRKMSNIAILKEIFIKSVQSVQPKTLIRNNVKLDNSHLVINGEKYPLLKSCYMVGFGKAVLQMSEELESILGNRLERAIVSVPKGIFQSLNYKVKDNSKITFYEGAENNLPDEDAMKGALEIKELVQGLHNDDLLIVLISGGGSALLPLPIPPISLAQKRDIIKNLSRKGADITELNCIRKQISLVKGGGLAELAFPCKVVSLILSDIIGDPLDFIASGPTTPNIDTPQDAIDIIKKYFLFEQMPDSIKNVLEMRKAEFPNRVTSISNGKYNHVMNYIIGNNKIAAQSAKEHAATFGFQSTIVSTEIDGEVGRISEIYSEFARNVALTMANPSNKQQLIWFLQNKQNDLHASIESISQIISMDFSKSVCLIFAGEPTVVVKGTGKGGRNQQLALEFSIRLNKLEIESANISFLSCGTDGIDGPTDAAGAIGTSDLLSNSLLEQIKPEGYLDNNDSYSFFTRYQQGTHLVHVGHTGTNVMDLHILLIEPKSN